MPPALNAADAPPPMVFVGGDGGDGPPPMAPYAGHFGGGGFGAWGGDDGGPPPMAPYAGGAGGGWGAYGDDDMFVKRCANCDFVATLLVELNEPDASTGSAERPATRHTRQAVVDASGAFQPASVVNGYRKLRMLGSGAFGSVFLVEHIETGRLFALKELPREELKAREALTYGVIDKSDTKPPTLKVRRIFFVEPKCYECVTSQIILETSRNLTRRSHRRRACRHARFRQSTGTRRCHTCAARCTRSRHLSSTPMCVRCTRL
jgi:hypothetical protein